MTLTAPEAAAPSAAPAAGQQRFADPLQMTAIELADSLWEIVPKTLPIRWDDQPIRSLSASSINTFALCPEAYRRRYVLGQKHPITAKILIGRVVDETMNTYLRAWMAGTQLDAGQLREATRDQFAAELAEAVERDGVRWEDNQPDQQQSQDICCELVELARTRIVPCIERPISVQRTVSFKLAKHLDWEVVGTLDLECEYSLYTALDEQGEVMATWGDEPEPTVEREALGPLPSARHRKRPIADVPIHHVAADVVERTIVGIDDFKAKDSPIDTNRARGDVQASIYLANAWLLGERRERFRWLQMLKPGDKRQKASVKVTATQRTDAEHRATLVRLANIAAQIDELYRSRGPERMWPMAPAGSWKCSERYCDHFRERTCPMAGI